MWGSNESDEDVEITTTDPVDVEMVADPAVPTDGFIVIRGVRRRGGPHYGPGDHVPEDAFSVSGIKWLLQRGHIKRVGE